MRRRDGSPADGAPTSGSTKSGVPMSKGLAYKDGIRDARDRCLIAVPHVERPARALPVPTRALGRTENGRAFAELKELYTGPKSCWEAVVTLAERRTLLCDASRNLRSALPVSVRRRALRRSRVLHGAPQPRRQRRLRRGELLRRALRQRCGQPLRPRAVRGAQRSQYLLADGCEQPVQPDAQRPLRRQQRLRLRLEPAMPAHEPARRHGASTARDTPDAKRRSHDILLRGGSPRSRALPHLPGSPLLPDHRSCPCCENPSFSVLYFQLPCWFYLNCAGSLPVQKEAFAPVIMQ
jgi:hypothetical protein